MFAPINAVGRDQIIPSTGPHDQIYPSSEQLKALVMWELVEYDPEYGPNARVYRPTMLADTARVRSWLA